MISLDATVDVAIIIGKTAIKHQVNCINFIVYIAISIVNFESVNLSPYRSLEFNDLYSFPVVSVYRLRVYSIVVGRRGNCNSAITMRRGEKWDTQIKKKAIY